MEFSLFCDIGSLSQKMVQFIATAGKTSGLEVAKQMFKTGDARHNLEHGPVSDLYEYCNESSSFVKTRAFVVQTEPLQGVDHRSAQIGLSDPPPV
jgi:hypothetical protein